MKLNYQEALAYPYRYWMQCMLIPGAVVYVDIVFTILLLLILIAIAILVIPEIVNSADKALSLVIPQHLQVSMGNLPFLKAHAAQDWTQILSEPMNFLKTLSPSAGAENFLETLEAAESASGSDDDDYSGSGSSGGNLGGRWSGLIYSLYWAGFEWRLYGRLQQEGLNAEPPGMDQGFIRNFTGGLKLGGFYFIINLILTILVILPPILIFVGMNGGFERAVEELEAFTKAVNYESIVAFIFSILGLILLIATIMFFLSPFLLAPMIHSAQTRGFKELFDIPKAINITLPNYWQIILAFLLIAVTWIAYFTASIALCIVTCCTGALLFPFIWEGAFRATAAHLIAQAFDYRKPGQNQLIR